MIDGFLGGLVRLIGRLAGSDCMLVRLVRSGLRLGDAGLSALVGVLNVAMVLRRLGVEFVGLLDQRTGLRPHIIFGGASGGECKRQRTGQKRGTECLAGDLRSIWRSVAIEGHWSALSCAKRCWPWALTTFGKAIGMPIWNLE